jgi:UDP:flavonoid glycosyltransferase YjiC (YdhE family)
MARILVVTWDGGGNVPPLLGIAAQLQERGHGVRVIGHAGQAAAVGGAGLDFVPYPTARAFTSQRNNSPFALAATWGGADLGRDVVAEAAALAADLVVVDCLLPGAMHELGRAGIRYVVVEHLFHGFLPHLVRGPLGALIRMRGVSWTRGLESAEARLVTSLASLDPAGSGEVEPNVAFTGPVLDGVPAAPDEPTILVSLSTYGYTGMRACLQRVLDACADLPARVVLTTGPVVDPDSLRLPANAEAHRWLPHAEVMPQVSMVVGHGGHSTTMLALAHDLPVLVLPMHPLVDQPMVGTALEASGAGRRLSKKASPRVLRPAINALLGDGPHRAAAARFGAEIRATGKSVAADRIEDLVGNGVPA